MYDKGTNYDLNNLLAPGPGAGWNLQYSYAINNRGQIAGWGSLNGQTRAFLLTPVSSAVPEPGTLALLGLGALAAPALCRKRKAGSR